MLRRFENILVTRSGGYLRNPIREPGVTCAVCTTPVSGYTRCIACSSHLASHHQGLADAVAPLTYAIGGDQAAYMMRGYKAIRPIDEHVVVVSILIWLGIDLHTGCVGELIGSPVTHWATVPSLPRKPAEHPLHRIVAAAPPPNPEAELTASAGAQDPRAVTSSHFATSTRFTHRSHVLVLDDTWTSGGHAQSAALALRQAGAEKVSVMVAARWINRRFGGNDRFIRERMTADYDPRVCPWTGSACP